MQPLSIVDWEDIIVNVSIIFLFIFVNPIYALLLSAFINLTYSRINFFIFSFMFSYSFSLLFFLKDYTLLDNNSDIIIYMSLFEGINDLGWLEIFQRFVLFPSGNEPLFWVYVKMIKTFLSDSKIFFTFFQYFLCFGLTSFLGKIINKNKFVIIITCLLLINYSLLTILFGALRQTLGFLIFYIGIYLFNSNKKNNYARVIIYCSFFFHITIAPLIIFFELFYLFVENDGKVKHIKYFKKPILKYLSCSIFIIVLLNLNIHIGLLEYFRLDMIYKTYAEGDLNTEIIIGSIINWFTILMLFSLWMRRKMISNTDIFIITQFFIIALIFNMVNLPSAIFRYNYYTQMGGSMLIGLFVAYNYRYGFLLLSMLLSYNIYLINYNAEFVGAFTGRLHHEFINPVHGVFKMILEYDNILNY